MVSEVPVVIGENGSEHSVPGVVASDWYHRRNVLPDDVTGCGDWRSVAGDEDRIRKNGTAAGTPRTWPRLRVDA